MDTYTIQITSQAKEHLTLIRDYIKMGLAFEEKAFYDILFALREQYNFEYGADKEVDEIIIEDKCTALAKKVKEIIDVHSSWENLYKKVRAY